MHVQSCFSIVKKIHMSKRKKWHFRLALLGLSQNFTSCENFFDPYMIAIYGFDVTSDVHLNGTRIFLLHDTVFQQKGFFCQKFDFSNFEGLWSRNQKCQRDDTCIFGIYST